MKLESFAKTGDLTFGKIGCPHFGMCVRSSFEQRGSPLRTGVWISPKRPGGYELWTSHGFLICKNPGKYPVNPVGSTSKRLQKPAINPVSHWGWRLWFANVTHVAHHPQKHNFYGWYKPSETGRFIWVMPTLHSWSQLNPRKIAPLTQGNLEYPAYVGVILVAEEGSMSTSAFKCSTQREGTDDLKTPFQMPAFNDAWRRTANTGR